MPADDVDVRPAICALAQRRGWHLGPHGMSAGRVRMTDPEGREREFQVASDVVAEIGTTVDEKGDRVEVRLVRVPCTPTSRIAALSALMTVSR